MAFVAMSMLGGIFATDHCSGMHAAACQLRLNPHWLFATNDWSEGSDTWGWE
jgi:hypothetical protein